MVEDEALARDGERPQGEGRARDAGDLANDLGKVSVRQRPWTSSWGWRSSHVQHIVSNVVGTLRTEFFDTLRPPSRPAP